MGLKREGTEQLSIQWELGILDDGYIAGQVTYTERISVSDIDGLKIFKLYEHPEIWKETIEGKKGAQHPEIRGDEKPGHGVPGSGCLHQVIRRRYPCSRSLTNELST